MLCNKCPPHRPALSLLKGKCVSKYTDTLLITERCFKENKVADNTQMTVLYVVVINVFETLDVHSDETRISFLIPIVIINTYLIGLFVLITNIIAAYHLKD